MQQALGELHAIGCVPPLPPNQAQVNNIKAQVLGELHAIGGVQPLPPNQAQVNNIKAQVLGELHAIGGVQPSPPNQAQVNNIEAQVACLSLKHKIAACLSLKHKTPAHVPPPPHTHTELHNTCRCHARRVVCRSSALRRTRIWSPMQMASCVCWLTRSAYHYKCLSL